MPTKTPTKETSLKEPSTAKEPIGLLMELFMLGRGIDRTRSEASSPSSTETSSKETSSIMRGTRVAMCIRTEMFIKANGVTMSSTAPVN